MDSKQKNMKKEYICPNATVRDVYMKCNLLGLSGNIVDPEEPNAPCEMWTDNMGDVLGTPGSFHHGFEVDNSGFGHDLTGL